MPTRRLRPLLPVCVVAVQCVIDTNVIHPRQTHVTLTRCVRFSLCAYVCEWDRMWVWVCACGCAHMGSHRHRCTSTQGGTGGSGGDGVAGSLSLGLRPCSTARKRKDSSSGENYAELALCRVNTLEIDNFDALSRRMRAPRIRPRMMCRARTRRSVSERLIHQNGCLTRSRALTNAAVEPSNRLWVARTRAIWSTCSSLNS